MKIGLMIPIRIDCKERIENLSIMIEFFKPYVEFVLYVGEEDKERKIFIEENDNLKYFFIQSNSEYFHRTKMLNFLFNKTNTEIVSNYDCDVFFKLEDLRIVVEKLKEFDVVYPYNGEFLTVDRKDISKIKSYNFDAIVKNVRMSNSVGGAIFYNRESYIKCGGENENFISWGWEDNERWERYKILNLKVTRTNNSLYHIDHPRMLNSTITSKYKENELECLRVKNMNKAQLEDYIIKGNYLKS